MIAIVGLVLPSLVAYALLTRPVQARTPPISRALSAAIAPGLGLAFSSCLYLAILIIASSHSGAVRFDAAFWTVAAVCVGGDRYFQARRISARSAGLTT